MVTFLCLLSAKKKICPTREPRHSPVFLGISPRILTKKLISLKQIFSKILFIIKKYWFNVYEFKASSKLLIINIFLNLQAKKNITLKLVTYQMMTNSDKCNKADN